MHVVPLALRRDPLDVLASLASEPGAFLLDVPDAAEPLTLVGCAPRATLRVLADGTVVGGAASDPLAAVEAFVCEEPADLPFPFGAVIGYLAYELGRFTVPGWTRRAVAGDLPLAVLARYDPLLVYARTRGQYLLASRDRAGLRAP